MRGVLSTDSPGFGAWGFRAFSGLFGVLFLLIVDLIRKHLGSLYLLEMRTFVFQGLKRKSCQTYSDLVPGDGKLMEVWGLQSWTAR